MIARRGLPSLLMLALWTGGPALDLAQPTETTAPPDPALRTAEASGSPDTDTAPETDALARVRRELEEEISRASAALAAMDRAALEREYAAQESAVRASLDRAAAMQVQLGAVDDGSPEADRLYDAAVSEIVAARERLVDALGDLTAPSRFQRFATSLDLSTLRASTLADRAAELDRLCEAIDRRVADLRTAEQRDRWRRVLSLWGVVHRLNDVRIRTIDRLSTHYRDRVLGFSPEGIAQLRREVGHLSLATRVQSRLRWHQLGEGAGRLRDPFVLGAAVWIGLKVLLVLGGYVLLIGKGRQMGRWIGQRRRRRWGRSGRREDAWLDTAAAVGRWLLVILLLRALWWALGPTEPWGELRLVYQLALLYAVYRVALDLIVQGGLALGHRYRLEFGERRTAKLVASAKTVLRVVLAVLVLLTLSARFLGKGYLYHVVVRLALIALLLAGLRVFSSWRRDIADAYLGLGHRGRLTQWVERTRDRWYGGFVAAAALLVLSGRAAVAIAGEFALGFNQTRRALAFLFRRRIEKQAARTGYAEPAAVEDLPAALCKALSEEPVTDERMTVDFFPGLDGLHAAIGEWRERGAGGSFLLTGAFGVGRTTWLGRIGPDGLPVQRVTFDRRLDSPKLVASALSAALELGPLDDPQALGRKLIELPPRLIVVDRGQNLFLGRVGGYAGFEAFMSLVESTTKKVYWVVTFSQFAWEHIAAVHPHLAGFRTQHTLEPWPEERIGELIRKRVAASSVDVVFDDLMLDPLERLSRKRRAEEAEAGYVRLLWDHCLGLPRVALTYWLRSLVADGEGRARVRLFRSPAVEALEQSGDAAQFLLAAITVHESLTLEEMSVVTRYPKSLCRIQVARLEGLGVLRGGGGRYWVTSYWQPAVLRLLKRHNLLSD